MFQNSYQNGSYFEVFDPKVSQDKIKNLFRVYNVRGNNKVFDKQLKSYVLDFASPSAKIVFPKEDRKQLYLMQQYLNIQVMFYPGMSWSIELAISDLTKTKRRIVLSPVTKSQSKPFYVRFPCPQVQEGIWVNLAIDVYSFIAAFKGQSYRSLDSISMTGHFKLRKLFTTQQPFLDPQDPNPQILPKTLYFPIQTQYRNHLLHYETSTGIEEQIEELTESYNDCSNFVRNNSSSTPTAHKNKNMGYQGEKKFLADTDGPAKSRRRGESPVSVYAKKNRLSQKANQNGEKRETRGKTLGKTNLQKNRESLQRLQKNTRDQQKQKTKNKLNPWRSIKKHQNQGDSVSQLSSTKPLNGRDIESAQTTLLITKNKLGNKFNDSFNKGLELRSDQYSDSEYVELSQKFSTITQGRFFKNPAQTPNLPQKTDRDTEEIEQHIEVESGENPPEHPSVPPKLTVVPVPVPVLEMEIDHSHHQESMAKSYYGFGENIIDRFLCDQERPYSPPLGEREQTEDMSDRGVQEADEKEVELIYDPVLNCYYDHKTHTYYELKN